MTLFYMNLDKMIYQFNNEDTKLIVSGWPSKATNSKHSGVATFTKATVMQMAKQTGGKIVVLAEMNGNNDPELLVDGKVLILRVFDHKHPSLYPTIITWLKKFNLIKTVTVHSEFSANGSRKNFLLNIPFLAIIRMMGRYVKFYAHNIVDDIESVAPHFDIKTKSLKAKILSFAMKWYYRMLGQVVDEVIVLSPVLYDRAKKLIPRSKIFEQFHPVWNQSKKKGNSDRLRKKYGFKKNDKVLLYFGFLTWYKGVDWLVQTFEKLSKDIKYKNYKLVIAGGASFTLNDKPYYQKYYRKIAETVAANPNMVLTGFINDEEVSDYFDLADLAVFPYRSIIGASGCQAQAIAYGKPFILSQELAPTITGKEWEESLVDAQLNIEDICFYRNINTFKNLLDIMNDDEQFQKLVTLSKSLKKKFSLNSWIKQYHLEKVDVQAVGFLKNLLSLKIA